MADINVDVNLPSVISVDITSPTQALVANVSIAGPIGPQGPVGIQGPSGEAAILPTTILYTTGNQIKSGRLIIGNSEVGVVDPNSPYTLSVQSNYTNTWLEILNDSGHNQGVFFGINGNDFEQYNYQGGDILFFTSEGVSDGLVRLTIKNDGKVGIGTNSPSEKLEVVGNIKAGGAIFANNLEVQETGIFDALDLSNISEFNFSGTDINLINGNVNISGQIYISGNPVLTGINSSSYATITNLASTGSTLNTRINSLSGTLTGNYLTTSSTSSTYATITNLGSTGSTLNSKIDNLSGVSVLTFGNQIITGNKIFNSLRIEPSGRAFDIGTGLNINSESGIVRINTNISSSLGAGFTYALNSGVDPNTPLNIEGRGRLVHGLSLDAGSNNFTSASDHFHLFFSAGPNNPGSFNGRYSTDTDTNYKMYQFSPTTRPNGNDNLRDLIHLTTLEAKGAGDQTFPTSNLTELYLTTTGTTVVTPPGTGLVELAYAVNSQATSQYLHSTGDTVYLRVFPGVAGIVANTYNGTVVTRVTGLDPAYGSTNVYKVGIALGALGINNNFNSAQRGTSTQTDSWTLSRSTPSNAFTGITRIERNSSQYLDQFNVFYTSPITGYTGETVVVDVFNRGPGTFIASGITLTQARYDGYVSKVLSSTGLEITLSLMNFGSLGGVGRPGAFHNPSLTTGSAFISSEDLITGMKILRGSSDSVHRNYWAHNVFAGFRNVDANELNVPAGVITRVAVGGLNRVESGSTSAIGFNNKAYALNSHAYGAHQENYNRNSVRIGATTDSYINIVSGRLGVNVVNPSATIDIGTGNIIAGGLLISGDVNLTVVGNVIANNLVYNTGDQTISGNKYFKSNETIFGYGDMGLVRITDDSLGSELGMITNSDEIIAVKMNDGSFQYGGGSPGNAPIIVNSNGNVGIGTNNPTEKLQVDGGIRINGGDLIIYDGPNGENNSIVWREGELSFADGYNIQSVGFVFANGPLGEVSINSTLNNTSSILYIPSGKNDYIAVNGDLVATGSSLNTQIENAKKLAIAYAIAL